ncbi:hypothetical protein [Ferruginibacter profundus]
MVTNITTFVSIRYRIKHSFFKDKIYRRTLHTFCFAIQPFTAFQNLTGIYPVHNGRHPGYRSTPTKPQSSFVILRLYHIHPSL